MATIGVMGPGTLQMRGGFEVPIASSKEIIPPGREKAYGEIYQWIDAQTEKIGWLLPESEREHGVAEVKRLIAGTAQLVGDHMLQGEQSRPTVELLGYGERSRELSGTEPLQHLADLGLALWAGGELFSRPTMRAVLAAEGDGFRTYRFVDTATNDPFPPCAYLTVRPHGTDINYYPKFEHGKVHKGVLANAALTVDTSVLRDGLSDGRYDDMVSILAMRTNRERESLIGIRIEREVDRRAGDTPSSDQGELTLDVSSVFTGSGHLLAAGNSEPGLNHIRGFGTDAGTSKNFASHVCSIESMVKDRLIVSHQIKPLRRVYGKKESDSGFPHFRVGENPYYIPGIRQLAHSAGVELPEEPTDESLQELFAAFGTERSFRANIEKLQQLTQGIGVAGLAHMIERTGITAQMPLRNIEGAVGAGRHSRRGIVLEGTAAWMGRRARELINIGIEEVVLGATHRALTLPTELNRPDVVALQRQLRRDPTAVDYMDRVIRPRLLDTGVKKVEVVAVADIQQQDGTRRTPAAYDVALEIAHAIPEIATDSVIQGLNAPAGYTFEPVLSAFKKANPDFDPTSLLFSSGPVPLARTETQADHPLLYQNPYSAPSSIVRWLHALHRLQTGAV